MQRLSSRLSAPTGLAEGAQRQVAYPAAQATQPVKINSGLGGIDECHWPAMPATTRLRWSTPGPPYG